MAVELPQFSYTLSAAEDMSSAQYHFVVHTATAETVDLADSQGEEILGVVQNNPTSGKDATVTFSGLSKVVAGEAITAGDKITAGADARAETAATGDFVAGVALTAASADGEFITVLVQPGARASA